MREGLRGGAQRFTWRCAEVYMEVHGGLCGGVWRFTWRFLNPKDLIGCGGDH